MNYYRYDFETVNDEQAEKLIALLSDIGFEGFEEGETVLSAFISSTGFNKKAFENVIEAFPDIIYVASVIENQNWNQQWETSFQPVIVGDKIAVRAGFHEPIKNLEHEIIITPKMSFGTGHHATTYMMIQLMMGIEFKNKIVVDFGTGTGVLAILAEKLGASKIFAIDCDDWSMENAKENMLLNAAKKIVLSKNEVLDVPAPCDVILANITLNVISDNLERMGKFLHAGGKLLISGFLKTDEDAIKAQLARVHLAILKTVQRGDWMALLVEK